MSVLSHFSTSWVTFTAAQPDGRYKNEGRKEGRGCRACYSQNGLLGWNLSSLDRLLPCTRDSSGGMPFRLIGYTTRSVSAGRENAC